MPDQKEPAEPLINSNPDLQSYYNSIESRIGYRLVLGGTRHFGFYKNGSSFPFPIGPALRRMEEKLLDALRLPKNAQIVDAGCGISHVALYMARHGMRVTGIDVIEHHLVKARRNIAKSGLPEGQVTATRMDYHHLETISDESHDGLYTMETFVHATDPEAALAGFFRILRPGGRIALFEYDQILCDDKELEKEDFYVSYNRVNKAAAMPLDQRIPGRYQVMLEKAGFQDIEIRDYSNNILPMLRLFWALALIPYWIIKILHLDRFFTNTIAGYHGYRAHKYWRFLAISATKPGGPLEVAKDK